MTWLVFGVSCLLVLAGAVSIISGAPIIQIERGWTEVIAGTVALSSGGIVFALAAILVRLESLRDTLAIPRAVEVPAFEDSAASPMTAVAPPGVVTPAQAPEESAVVAEASPPDTSDNETGHGLWKRVKRSGEIAPAAGALERSSFLDRMNSVEALAPTPGTEAVSAPPAPTTPVLAIDRADETDYAAIKESSQLGWLERSLFKGRLPKSLPDDRTSVLPEPRTDTSSIPGQISGSRIDPALDVEPATNGTPPSSLSDGNAEAIETETGVTVIGRYQAGVASYIMYSDGTIEVETEGGQSHRFASMEELKAFIADQDNVLS